MSKYVFVATALYAAFLFGLHTQFDKDYGRKVAQINAPSTTMLSLSASAE